jgi:hypothetical protein
VILSFPCIDSFGNIVEVPYRGPWFLLVNTPGYHRWAMITVPMHKSERDLVL